MILFASARLIARIVDISFRHQSFVDVERTRRRMVKPSHKGLSGTRLVPGVICANRTWAAMCDHGGLRHCCYDAPGIERPLQEDFSWPGDLRTRRFCGWRS